MDNFVVSARKYRPSTFDTVIGQESITGTLKNAIRNNQLAQAFLFCGPRGVGKTTCARILAKTINCYNPKDQIEPCNVCESCVSFNRSASFNIFELDAASNNSVDDIRNLVDQVRIPPQVGQYKVYIIDEVHMLSQSAFNAFLKTLEEPPHYAKFILATTEKHKIIPTILSRCQIFDFKRITVKDIAAYLAFVAKNEGINASEEALHMIAQKADGALRDALSFFDQLVSFAGKELTSEIVIEHLNILDCTYYFRIVDQMLQRDAAGTLLTINEVIDRGFDGQHFLIGLGEHLRNLLVGKDPATIKLLEVSPQVQGRFAEQSAACSEDILLKALEIHNQCDLNYKSSNNKRLHLELAMLQMCALTSGGDRESEKNKLLPEPRSSLVPDNSKKAGSTPTLKIPRKDIPLTATASSVTAVPGIDQPSRPRTISIRPENHKEADKPAGNGNITDTSITEHKEFTQEQLDKVWIYFTESIAQQYPTFYAILNSRKPMLKENYLLELQLENRGQEMILSQRKQEFLDFLRAELKNYKIGLEIIITGNDDNSKPYTADEKFRAMVTKNPLLKELKEKLDLEIDY